MRFFLVLTWLNVAAAAINAIWIDYPINAAVVVMCLVAAATDYWCYRDSKAKLA